MRDIWSKNMRPDSLVYNPNSKEITVIEMKFQNSNALMRNYKLVCLKNTNI